MGARAPVSPRNRPRSKEIPGEMALIVDVESRLDKRSTQDTAEELRATMTAAIRDAVEDILFGLTVTPEERRVVENHRSVKRARLLDGHRAIVAQLHAKVPE